MTSILPSTSIRTCHQLVLLVSLMWAGPIPVGHSHAAVTYSTTCETDLAQHLMIHHGGGWHNNAGCQWHFHWVFRGVNFSGINCEASVAQPMSNDSAISNELVDRLISNGLVVCFTSPVHFSPNCSDGITLSATDWLRGHHLRRISIPTLSSVMRC